MSRQIGLDTIHLRPTPRVAHTEYSMEYHHGLLKAVTGLDPAGPDRGRAIVAFQDAWDYDFAWSTNDGPINWAEAGRATDMGHAVYAADGSDQRAPAASPFTDPEQVYAFEPEQEYGLWPHRELVAWYEERYRRAQAARPNQVVTGGYYKTVVSGAIAAFGWDALLEAAADRDRFAQVLRRIGDYTCHYVRAQAETSIEVFIQHDDMVWTAGPFMDPAVYRGVIFPIYRKLWEPLKRAGKKVLFCSDGTFDMFYDDIAACGADGFILEPSNDLDALARRYGRTHAIVGSKVDCRTMAFGTWEQVKAEIDATLPLARACPGFMWAVGNHIPANVSDEMCGRYMDYLRANWQR